MTSRKTIAILTLSLILAASSGWAREVYKWVDENGQIHYGEAPQGDNAQSITLKSGPAKESGPHGTASTETLKNVSEELKKKREEREKQNAGAADSKKQDEEKARRCKNLNDHLKNLTDGLRIVNRDANGEIIVMSDEDRQKDIATTQKRIQEECGKK